MILTIVNILCLIIIIAVILYIVLQYLNIKSDIDKMNKIIPTNIEGIKNTLKDIQVPTGPGPAPIPTPSPSPSAPATPAPPSSQPKYTPPNDSMKEYYILLTSSLSIFEKESKIIIATIASDAFATTKDAKTFLGTQKQMIPIIQWYMYENSDKRKKLDSREVQMMYDAINYYNTPSYSYISATGQNYHFSTLTMSSAIQKFYENNKIYLDECTKANTC